MYTFVSANCTETYNLYKGAFLIDMKQQVYLLILLSVLYGLTSCTTKPSSSSSSSVFFALDSLLETHPDSALSRIRGIDMHSLFGAERAEYALLLVKAMDKNYIPLESDSLIMIAVDYYKNRSKSLDQQAKSYYYLGRVYQETGNDILAVDAFLKTLDIVDKQGASKLQLYATINLAACYYYQDLYSRAMKRYQKATEIANQLGDSSSLFFPLRATGRIYMSMNQPDSALVYYEKSLALTKSLGDSVRGAAVLSDIAQFYNIRQMYDKANEYISRAINISSDADRIYYYSLKGDILSKSNRLDSAHYYLEKCLDINNIYSYVSLNYALYNLEKKVGNYKKAVDYADNYIVYYDSIQHQIQRAEITKLMNDYALESHKKEIDARQKSFMQYLVIGFLVLLSICVFVFFHIDRQKKQTLIGLQQNMMHNRSQLSQLQHKLAKSNTEIRMERQENESTQHQLQLRQKELCMRLFEASAACKMIQDFSSAKRQKKYPKELTDKERVKMQQTISEIYIDFIHRQQQAFPQLSQGDIYCCVLAYMGFSNSLIGYVMGVDPNVVTQRRYRIKGKVDETNFNLIFSSSAALK